TPSQDGTPSSSSMNMNDDDTCGGSEMTTTKLPKKEILFYGSDELVPNQKRLRVGPFSLILQGTDLRQLKLGGTEVVQRIYGAVRDRDWDTIPATFSDLKIEASRNSFEIDFL